MEDKLINQTLNNLLIVSCIIICLSHNMTAADPVIQNDVFWKDISGNPVYSQGGGVYKFGDTYYWYGAKYEGAVTYCNNPTKIVSKTVFSAVTCYSSKDLVNWKFENNILEARNGGNLDPSNWIGRLGVAYNANTKKYVLVSQCGGTPNSAQLFATCETPNGKFTVDHTQATLENVVNNTPGDQTIFIDDDGKAYMVLSSSSGRANIYVAPLRESDFLSVEPATRVFGGVSREGNCMFKYNGRYYICSSDLHGWNASHCYYISATNILGPYSSEAVMKNTDLDFCHVTQTGFFITVKGTESTTVLFCGDRWSDFAGNGLGYNQWCPLSFDGTVPIFNSVSQFEFNAEKGTWKTAGGNNYVLNPGFEADRVSQNVLAGWKNTSNISGSDPNGNVSGGHTGRFSMQQTFSSAFNATMSQDISGLPDGSYMLNAWAQCSGGQKSCKIYVKNSNGNEKSCSIAKASSWTQLSISDINITDGKCQVGISSDANAGNWAKVDDISLINTSQVSVLQKQRFLKPVPGKSILKVSSTNAINFPTVYKSAVRNITAFDLRGRSLQNIVTDKNSINLERSGISTGIYLLKIDAGNIGSKNRESRSW